MVSKQKSPSSGGHHFGGGWTDKKLEILSQYLRSYTTALKKTSFRTTYIDAFAGTGYRLPQSNDSTELLFPDLADNQAQRLLDGSARIALKTEPPFDRYIFIEINVEKCNELEKLKSKFPSLAGRVEIEQGDANVLIQDFCAKRQSWDRAVLFLDPYGMEVEWATLEAIARTKAIDLWILFPLGMGVNRLLPRSGNVPESWKRRLNVMLGTSAWYDEFYKVSTDQGLFNEAKQVGKAHVMVIGRYFNNRLSEIFAGVAPGPKVLVNSKNSPLYLLCFAVGNPNQTAKQIALRIAGHLLNKV